MKRARISKFCPEIGAGLEFVDRVQHIIVLAHQEQDERTGNAGQDHRADGDRSAEHEVDVAVGRILEQRQPDDDPAGGPPGDQRGDAERSPFAHPVEYGEDGSDDQPEKESPDQHGLILEHPVNRRGKDRDGGEDAESENQQERPRQGFEHFPDLKSGRHADGFGGSEALDRFDQFLVDAENEGHGSAGDAGNDVGSAHDEAGDVDPQMLSDRTFGCFLFAHVCPCVMDSEYGCIGEIYTVFPKKRNKKSSFYLDFSEKWTIL